jgi:hypothetical protein
MIRKLVNKACREYFNEHLQPQIVENEVARMEQRLADKARTEEIKRHNALVEGWLKAFMTAQGVNLDVSEFR